MLRLLMRSTWSHTIRPSLAMPLPRFLHQCTCTLSPFKSLGVTFPDRFDSCVTQQHWMASWQEAVRKRREETKKERFTLILPPPNVTGDLHMGHALTVVIQDLLIRLHKMRGFDVEWVPGADHAGIATQVIMEKRLLARKGMSRHEVGRDVFLDETHKYKEERIHVVKEQLHAMGALLHWPAFYFTLDETHSSLVRRAFCALHSKGLVYRKKSFVNWSSHLGSVLSDAEVEHLTVKNPTEIRVPGEERKLNVGLIYDIAYTIKDSKEEVIVSTTRPETLLGDVAIAVHPSDTRYAHLTGQFAIHPFRSVDEPDHLIPIVQDDLVDVNMGSGAVKITPHHDQRDFEIATKAGIEEAKWRCVISDEGRICSSHPSLHGLTRFEGRREILKILSDLDLFRGQRNHSTSIPLCSRSKDVIEPRLKEQWFLDCKPLIEQIKKALDDRKIDFDPSYQEKILGNFLQNTNEWCISRQIWWGHRIPAFRRSDTNEWIVAESVEDAQAALHGNEEVSLVQDEDVLDTWFSSALIPLAIQGWPKSSDNDNKPILSLMETGHDILFFWVARMMMLSLALSNELPFNKVLLHGVICDRHRRKMSKSLGNVVDPLHVINGASLSALESEVRTSVADGKINESELNTALDGLRKDFSKGIPQCGADALRFTLANCDIKGYQISLDVDLFKSSSAFCNKIWQASRFLVHNFSTVYKSELKNNTLKSVSWAALTSDCCIEDRWILSKLNTVIAQVNRNLDTNNFHQVTRILKSYVHSNLCDVYIELLKSRLVNQGADGLQGLAVMRHCLLTALTLLHPIMPFVTEELFQRINHATAFSNDEITNESILLQPYPTSQSDESDMDLEANFDSLLSMVTQLRSVKINFELSRHNKPNLKLLPDSSNANPSSLLAFVSDSKDAQRIIENLASIEEVDCTSHTIADTDYVIQDFRNNIILALGVGSMIDLPSLLDKIERRANNCEKQLDKSKKALQRELSNTKSDEDEDSEANRAKFDKVKEMELKRDQVLKEQDFLFRLKSMRENST